VRPAAALARDSAVDWSEVYFAPIAATGHEASAIKSLFPEARLLTGSRATKTALQAVRAPRILHIASHGFFLGDPAGDNAPAAGRPSALLRSGLALAGANLARDGQAAGILTALEVTGLDLWGTRLVTLSACDTGVGEVRNGEGVTGFAAHSCWLRDLRSVEPSERGAALALPSALPFPPDQWPS